jgi:NAD-reducing hydrogenase small subunit
MSAVNSSSTAAVAPKARLATVWLDGCSGCHMSFLDIDERLIDLARVVELLYSPLVDRKDFPDQVDVTLVEGAVSTDEDLIKIREVRMRTKLLVALGDCAITGNVPAMRTRFGVDTVLDRAYRENAQIQQQIPTQYLPRLLDRVCPVHEVVDVDVFVPGCPPPADAIHYVISELLGGRIPDLAARTRFGR